MISNASKSRPERLYHVSESNEAHFHDGSTGWFVKRRSARSATSGEGRGKEDHVRRRDTSLNTSLSPIFLNRSYSDTVAANEVKRTGPVWEYEHGFRGSSLWRVYRRPESIDALERTARRMSREHRNRGKCRLKNEWGEYDVYLYRSSVKGKYLASHVPRKESDGGGEDTSTARGVREPYSCFVRRLSPLETEDMTEQRRAARLTATVNCPPRRPPVPPSSSLRRQLSGSVRSALHRSALRRIRSGDTYDFRRTR